MSTGIAADAGVVGLAPGADPDGRRVSDHWGEQFERMRADRGYWLNNPIVTEHIYRRIAGSWVHWLPWTMTEYFRDVPRFDRVLSVCCGDGAHEMAMMNTGKVGFLHGFDLSEGAVREAVARFERAGVPRDRYRFEVRDANAPGLSDGRYDLVLSAGAVHHVSALEGLLGEVAGALAPGGRFVLMEFVGASRFQWTDRQVDLINRVLGALDPKYLRDGVRVEFARPTVEQMIEIDPSEAVRSAEIPGLVDRYFEVEYRRDHNGALLHQLYPLLESGLSGRPGFDSIVRLILLLEDALMECGGLPADFTYMVCRARG
jgi:SAM-dependent methyltransferase